MPEIGATLREARMLARIDIAEIEQATKIRAKYLRALENEEWELLPGPTFVKTFLRTYAEALGLDAKLLVDEYKLRHERLTDAELRPIAPRGRGTGARPAGSSLGPPRLDSPGGGRPSRGPIVAVLVLALLVVLALIGLLGGSSDPNVSEKPTPPTTTSTATTTVPPSSGSAPVVAPKAKARKFATLKVLPTGNVNVCLRAEGQGTLINGIDLRKGEDQKTYRSSRFTLALGNANARIRWNGKTFTPSASSSPIGYAFTATGRTRLKAADLPTCRP